ncbi:hypothetical protein M3936_19770 [Sutcliffiella horikoshii]|uniref:hypothetical protein n=1 Tax=Sutcliffiella horikoshii TaxID=79883 RepID=UPI0020419397|nr:hypothetical protein [Sutcliffiella horikoshii]MCM3619813.1 hypothetical protein [Sutcliffiella horikoshii]
MATYDEKNILATVKYKGKNVPIYQATVSKHWSLQGALIEWKAKGASKPERRELIGIGFAFHEKLSKFVVTKRADKEIKSAMRLARHLKDRYQDELDISNLEQPFCLNLDSHDFDYVRFIRPNGREVTVAI